MTTTSIPNYRHFGNIIEAARALTGSSAKTKKGAWDALRKKHLARVFGKGLLGKNTRNRLIGDVWCNKTMSRTEYYSKKWRARADRGGEKMLRALGLKTRLENIAEGGSDDWEKRLFTRRLPLTRGAYGELICAHITCSNVVEKEWLARHLPLKAAEKCVRAIEQQGFDEHGGWTSGASFDKRNRGEAINTDIYGVDDENRLYVVQVRQFSRRYKNGFGSVRKNYFLVGYNENGNPFAHSIPSRTVHAAIKKDPSPESPVKAAQAWIWGVAQDKLGDILRNGDVALIPAGKNFKKDVEEISGMMQIVDSHYVYTKKIYRNGALYAHNPTLRHMKGQHPTQKGNGWFKIMVGNRADYHSFAAPTAD